MNMYVNPIFNDLRAKAIKCYGENIDHTSIVNFPFVVASNFLQSLKVKITEFGLEPNEVLALGMLQGFHFRELQSFYKSNDFLDDVRFSLSAALQKLPKTRYDYVYRNEENITVEEFRRKYSEGQIYTHPCFLTASKDDFDNRDFKFIIKPLPNDKTKGHDIFLFYNHGEEFGNPEYQIEFELNAKFIIDRITKFGAFLIEIE